MAANRGVASVRINTVNNLYTVGLVCYVVFLVNMRLCELAKSHN